MVVLKIEPKSIHFSTIKLYFRSIENKSNIDMALQKFWKAKGMNSKKPLLSEKGAISC